MTEIIDLDHVSRVREFGTVGKFENAIALLKQAMRLDPYYPGWYLARLGINYHNVGRFEESVKALERTSDVPVKVEPRNHGIGCIFISPLPTA